MHENNENKKTKRGIYFIILALIVVGIFYGVSSYSRKSTVYNLMSKYNLIPKAETFTELYFTNYPNVQSRDIFRGKIISFSFTVHNLEGKDEKYNYSSSFHSTNGSTKLLDSNVLNIVDKDSKTVTEYYVFDDVKDYGTLEVSLDDLNQKIFLSIPNIK